MLSRAAMAKGLMYVFFSKAEDWAVRSSFPLFFFFLLTVDKYPVVVLYQDETPNQMMLPSFVTLYKSLPLLARPSKS